MSLITALSTLIRWLSAVLIAVGGSIVLIVILQLLDELWMDWPNLIIGLTAIVLGALFKEVISEQDRDR